MMSQSWLYAKITWVEGTQEPCGHRTVIYLYLYIYTHTHIHASTHAHRQTNESKIGLVSGINVSFLVANIMLWLHKMLPLGELGEGYMRLQLHVDLQVSQNKNLI